MRIEYHRLLIDDRVRVAAFHEALKRVIKPGETIVADIGAGTGLIGVMAARLGAKRVYLYEAAEVAGVAAEVLKRNRVKNAELFRCHSTAFEDPPRVDVVVSETLGNYALEEDIIDTMADAARRHLKPGGLLIPSRLTQYAAPVISPRIDRELRAWDRATQGLSLVDLSPAKALTLNNIYVRTIVPAELSRAPAAGGSVPPLATGAPPLIFEGGQGGSLATNPTGSDMRIAAKSVHDATGGTRGAAPPLPPLEGEGGRTWGGGGGITRIAAQQWDTIDLGRDKRSARRGESSWPLAADATVYGFALWWRAELVPGVTLSTAPDAPATHWEQLYLPLLEPIAASAGARIALTVKSRTTREAGTTIAWSVVHADAAGKTISRQNMDLEKGYLF